MYALAMELNDMFSAVNDVISTEMDGDAVLMHVSKGKYFSLNETGSLIWRELEKGSVTLEKMINAVCDEFDVEEALCRGDLEKLLDVMLKMNIVEKVL